MKKYWIAVKNLFIYNGFNLIALMAAGILIVLMAAYIWGVPLLLNIIDDYKVNFEFAPLIIISFLCIIPLLTGFYSAFIVLEELDNKVEAYFYITPLGKGGYLFTRIIIQSFYALILNLLFFIVIDTSFYTRIELLYIILGMALEEVIICLIILNFASNRVEGMAVGKISGLYLAIMFMPFILQENMAKAFVFFPSFWLGMMSIKKDFITFAICCCVSTVWILVLYKRFIKKLE